MSAVRSTKYSTAVKDYLRQVGHATNAQVLDHLQVVYPDVSATTVHRITARLLERGELQLAQVPADSGMVFDANILPHDHFQCTHCGRLRDADLRDQLRATIEEGIGDGCRISGRLTILGLCRSCTTKQGGEI